jgi:alcohol dehydrogenase (cytochrome c)
MGYDRKSYSPLKQINKSNVKKLVPIWSTSLMNDQGELAAPTIYNGVMYLINGKWTFAIDVETGKQIWRTAVELESGVQRSAYNRGAPAIYNGKLFRVTIDNHVLALDMKTGSQIWNQKFADAKDGYYATSAPIVANGVLISGVAGGESTTRGFGRMGSGHRKEIVARDIRFPRQANPARRRGRRLEMPGLRVAVPPGARVPTILNSIWSIGA